MVKTTLSKAELEQQKKWDKRFMDVARLVSTWTNCARTDRAVGAVIVRERRIVATGYNGAPANIMSCAERGGCMRKEQNIASGTQMEKCYSVCAEQNSIAQAAKMGHEADGGTMYITHSPCSICARLIINAGIKRVVFGERYPEDFTLSLFKEAGIELVQYKE